MVRKRETNASVAAVLSLLVPGLGQIYAGKGDRGAAILIAGIIVGTLALIWQTLAATSRPGELTFWAYRITLVIYAAIFWIWQVIDAYKQAK